ncbi:MAG: tRNA (adenosine(37)-N6)-threonylcarbamoyltransferase complex ATPase subunit type 1 TsaE [Nitrospirae bacterium]|nr:tRNA (adenosine(37)-N6)-threonylcarbamoyltransferase complex ATPase subunit type 1 TsaE [Nitrospirota bacterium]
MRGLVKTESADQTVAAGRTLGSVLKGGEVITLSGPLGAGKTSFVKGIGAALGIHPENLCSPTFILRGEYRGKFPLAHVDLYRLDSPEEVQRLGLFEQEDPETVLIIEWPERAKALLPPDRLDIQLTFEGEDKRALHFSTAGVFSAMPGLGLP